MLLNQTAVYGLRAVAVLAALPEDESATGDILSERTEIPRQYLAKVMRRLVVAGLVRSQRGQGGGFALARPAAEIRIADVLAATDCDVTPDRCVFGVGACDPEHPCTLHPIWSRLGRSVSSWAEDMTLADLGPPSRRTRGTEVARRARRGRRPAR